MLVSSICASATPGAAAPTALAPAPSIAVLRKPRLPSFTCSLMEGSLRSGVYLFGLSYAGAARVDRPQGFDPAVAHADVPVVQVHGRIAVARDQPHLLADAQALRVRRELELAVLVGDAGDLDAVAAVHPWRPLLGAIGLEPGVDDGAVGRRHADHGRKHEQARS